MKRTSWMYKLLGEMITSAKNNDKDEVFQLRRVYESLAFDNGYSRQPTPSDLASDTCMLYCVFSVDGREYHKGFREDFLREARREYSKIQKPKPSEK